MLTLIYLGAITGTFLSGVIPPAEPFISIISIVSLASVPIFIFLWVLLHNAISSDKKIFTQTSLTLIVIFATLTSINRYIAMTVIRQSIDMGITDGLNWFMPYGWPSIMAALEVLAWGFFLGLAMFALAPAFRAGIRSLHRITPSDAFAVLCDRPCADGRHNHVGLFDDINPLRAKPTIDPD